MAERLNSLSGHTGLNEQRTQQILINACGLAPTIMVKPRCVPGGLHIHPEVDDIHQHLHMALRAWHHP